MKLPRLVILLALALAGATVSSASASAAPTPTSSADPTRILRRRPCLRQRQHRGVEHRGRLRPARRRLAHARSPAPRSQPAAPDRAPGWPRRAPSSSPATGATCSRSTPRATRSRCCDSASTACRSRSAAPVSSGGSDPVSIAVSGNLVYVANAGASEPNVTGFLLGPERRPVPAAGLDRRAARRLGSRMTCCSTRRATSSSSTLDNTSTIASFHVRSGWPARRRSGLTVRGPGTRDRSARSSGRPIRHSCSSATPTASEQAPGRSRPSCVRWLGSAGLDRLLPVRRSADGAVLGGDQPRRAVPVHREHRVGRDLELLDQPRWLAGAARQHAVRLGGRRRR